ncbi:MAG: EAL domain-containing protein, partial [Treponema sp.]|nr:EAL domain-containing protein [Treponema sp.]
MADRYIQKTVVKGIKKHPDTRYLFQPVVSLRDGSIIGHEILSCSSAKHKHQGLFALDAVFQYMMSADNYILFFPLTKKMCADNRFFNGDAAASVVFEIHSVIISHERIQHLALVIDDTDSLYPLGFLSEFHPQYVKLSSSLVQKAETDTLAHAFVKSVTGFCHTAGIDVIAEGVETQKDLAALIDLGVSYAQGNFIQEPSGQLSVFNREAYDFIVEKNRKKNHINGQLSEVYIANLCTATRVLPPGIEVGTVYEMVITDSDCFGYCIVQDSRVLGIITRDSLIMHMSGRYGFMLYQKKP